MTIQESATEKRPNRRSASAKKRPTRRNSPVKTEVRAKNAARGVDVEHLQDQLARFEGALHALQTAIMMVDRDLVVTYANPATVSLLKKYEAELQAQYRGFDAANIVGTCIDIFHKNPSHQRRMLADPRNLPHIADIKVGPLTFEIQVSAVLDAQSEYVGNCLEWYDVTEQRRRATEVSRLTTAIEGADTALMMIDRDLCITYVNQATRKLFARREAELKAIYPSFDPSGILGTNIDDFHRNPAHQRKLLSDPRNLPYATDIKVGDLCFSITVNALHDEAGRYIGNTMEWEDVTDERDAQSQLEGLVRGAIAGELDARVDASRYEGSTKILAEEVNRLMDSIVEPTRAAIAVAEALAQGDLNTAMQGSFEGEFARLQNALNGCIDNLQNMVGQIHGTAGTISSGASNISEGNANLSHRTQEQASALEETASALEQITSTIRQNACNSQEANQLAQNARESAEKGGEVVGSAVKAMFEITSSSKKISDIIGVIEQIAFQTNMLALNAAVEAARAGDQGRGFAVVAGEVRNLAQRSSTAAKDIKKLIEDSLEKVQEGSRLVDGSGETLREIVTAVKKVSDIMGEIAAAGEEQASGIEQLNVAVSQMDQTTQKNAALVEEAAAAAESLSDESASLTDLMQFFKLEESAPEVSVEIPSRRIAAQPAPVVKKARRKTKKHANGAVSDAEWKEF